ncbi:MAG: adenylosuccinate lyase [Candidatus Sumerlaeaceae bacterium]
MIDRYSTPEMFKLWSEQTKFESWLDVELAACEAWAATGKIPADDLKAIRDKAKFDVARIEELDRKLHHDVIAFTTNLAENIGPSSRFVHMGLTSTDVVDTAQSLRLRKAGQLILVEINNLITILHNFAYQHKHTVMIGRTHGVHAEPITLGLKFLVFHQEMLRNRTRVQNALADVAVGKISGAVGTHAHTGPDFEERICKALKLAPAPVATQVLQRDRHAALIAVLTVCAGTIEKIAVEIRHLQRTEVRELEEPFAKGQKGSSAMPHKRNPVKCEQLTGLARLFRGYAITAFENQALWHERDISHSSAERVILSDATTLLHYMLRQMIKVVSGLHVYPDSMLANLNQTRGLLFSQKILLELVNAGLSREDAYEIVQSAAMRTWADKNTSLRDELLQDTRFSGTIDAQTLEGLLDPASFLLHLEAIFSRAQKS